MICSEQLHSLLQPLHILKAWPMKNELLFTSLTENDNSPVLEAFAWFCVPLNINHNQKASDLFKLQTTLRNQEYNLLHGLHPLPVSSNAVSFAKTNLSGLTMLGLQQSQSPSTALKLTFKAPLPAFQTEPPVHVDNYWEWDCTLTALYCLPPDVVLFSSTCWVAHTPLYSPLLRAPPIPPLLIAPRSPRTIGDPAVWRLQLCIPMEQKMWYLEGMQPLREGNKKGSLWRLESLNCRVP